MLTGYAVGSQSRSIQSSVLDEMSVIDVGGKSGNSKSSGVDGSIFFFARNVAWIGASSWISTDPIMPFAFACTTLPSRGGVKRFGLASFAWVRNSPAIVVARDGEIARRGFSNRESST